MKRHAAIARDTEAAAGIERITHLEQQLAAAPARSLRHRRLRTAIRIEAAAYRKSLDTEQAAATHDANPLAVVASRSLNRTVGSRRPIVAPRRHP